MKYLVAVSGGVDSVVLLDKLVRDGEHELIVAHFDHGIREDSAADARFVRELAASYHLPFVTRREELGKSASEDLARTRRYEFLRAQAHDRDVTIVTAHHADDIVETIAINLLRGTGWRGLAVLDNRAIVRPLLHMTKAEIRAYALEHRLEWVEDATNSESAYLRNRLRRRLAVSFPLPSLSILRTLRDTQCALKATIDAETERFVHIDHTYSRYFLSQIDQIVAIEMVRTICERATDQMPTRPQAERALMAIKTARPGTTFQLGAGTRLVFTVGTFIVEP